jgi:Immune inhibitor A peptidase M6
LRRRIFPFFVGLGLLVGLLLPAAGFSDEPRKNAIHTADDVLHVGPDVSGLKLAGIPPSVRSATRAGAAQQAHGPAAVGEVRTWVALDNVNGFLYTKTYELRALGEHVEIWIATGTRTFLGVTSTDLDFQAGDCRNGPRTVVTDAQAEYLADEFDTNILPKESVAFSVAPDRDGTNAQLAGPPFHPTGEGDNTVVLVDNVRDENFMDLNNTQGFSYIAGFFSSQINDLFDRNIMSIDGFDWLHRTGANPPHEPVPGNNCTSAAARPFLYEGVFAHEYQHLLEHYEDPDELNWVNEGLSDWAQTLTGYVNPATPIDQLGFDSHIQCFLGYLGVQTAFNPNPRASGPENSLTLWEDQGDDEILCDYGAAYTIMEMLHGRYGDDFMSALHREDENGLAGLQAVLDGEQGKISARDVLHDWQLMVAVDALLDDGASLSGPRINKKDVTAPTLDASINWDSAEAYSSPGAPPNGADYVRLRNAANTYLRGRDIQSIAFQGAAQIAPKPLQWTVDANPPGQAGDPALYSGTGDNRDEMAVRSVAVPAGAGAVLTFNARWNLEEDAGGPWDFGYVQVSTDGGSTYSSLTCTDTRTDHNPGAIASVVENLPGFSGDSALVAGNVSGWNDETCSLSDYAGNTVLLAFRTINDPAAQGTDPTVPPGFWVDDVTVGSTLISDGSTTDGWQSATQARPTSVENFTVYMLSVRDRAQNAKVTVRRLPLTSDFSIRNKIDNFVDKQAEFVAAIVIYDESTEATSDYAPYRLTVNGVVQPGGGM